METAQVQGISVWNERIRGSEIPGTTRVPAEEIARAFKFKTNELIGLDVGSGSGRSTIALKETITPRIISIDLSLEGLSLTPNRDKVQASAIELPFQSESVDFVSVCGVLTNICDISAEVAVKNRHMFFIEAHRVLKPGGVLVVSDFGAMHTIDDYQVNYNRHALITGEHGTIAVFGENFTFAGKSDEQLRSLRESPEGKLIVRYAHHFTTEELIDLFKHGGLLVEEYSVEKALTPRGRKPIENIIMVGKKES